MKKWVATVFGLSIFFSIVAQNIGQNPGQFEWKVLETPAGNVIYPKAMGEQSQRVANIINYQRDSLSESVGQKSKRINLIIQNQTVIPNGYVALSPFRSEIYATPPENTQLMGSVNWLDGLAIHEYRHVQQFANTQYGLTKFAYYLQGQNAWNVLANLSIPNWYFEGDAVITETALTNSGRGRIPSFSALQRVLAETHTKYKYQKVRNGSYKDLVPNDYATGYLMLSYLRNTKGNEIMVPVIKDASAYKGVVYPFSRALKKHTGYTSSSLYKSSWTNATEAWAEQTDTILLTPTISVSEQKSKTVTSYHFPKFTAAGEIVALKVSYKKTDQIVELTDDGERTLAYPGANLTGYFNHINDNYVWTEISQHPRHTNITYSDIFYKKTGDRKKKITNKGRYFSPVLSSDSLIIAISITENQICSIQQIDLKMNEEKTLLTFNKNEFIARTAYSEDNRSIIFVLKKNNQLALWEFNLISEEKTQLTPWTSHIIDAPMVNGNYVYFTASFGGIDNIYRSPIDGSLVIEQLTSVSIGAYDPCVSPDGKTLLFTEPTESGRVISKIELDKSEIKVLQTIVEPLPMHWQDSSVYRVEGGNILNKIPETHYEPKDYKGILKGLTLHSWSISPSLAVPELVFSFNNYLDDVSGAVGVGYNRNENNTFYRAEVVFGRWYPIFKLGVMQSERSSDYLDNDNSIENQTFNETSTALTVSVPLEWIKSNYSSGLSPSILFKHHWVANRVNTIGNLPDVDYSTLSGKLNFHSLRRKAYQNLAPSFGFSGSIEYLKNLNIANDEKFTGLAKIYLPGLLANHSLRISAAYRKELLRNVFQQFDDFEYIRGFNAPLNDSFTKFSIDYSLPLFYPDLGIWGITYFKRIRMNLFYDHGEARLLEFSKTFQSIGAELIFDNTFFNILPISIGIRGSYLLSGIQSDESRVKPSIFVFMGF